MIRIFKPHPSHHYQWAGRCEVDSEEPSYYIHIRNWPDRESSSNRCRFTSDSLSGLLEANLWIEEVDEDLVVDEGL